MIPTTIELFSSLECPYAYLTNYRLRQLWQEFAGKLAIVWRALSLEYINRRSYPKPLLEAEMPLFARLEPNLPIRPWAQPEWAWPTTFWPAYEALACAQAQGFEAAFEMSWALRSAFFAHGRDITLRHELLIIAGDLASRGLVDLARFEEDWDSGRYKAGVLAESRRGWHELRVNGSATLVLPGGRQVTNPAVGQIDFDEDRFVLRSFTPYAGDALQAYHQLLEEALAG